MSLVIKQVNKSYQSNDATKHVLKNVSFIAGENEFVCILGHSGCGKSTLLNLIAGFSRQDEGIIEVNGKPIEGPSKERGVVFQEHALFPWYTVIENIALGPILGGQPKAKALEMAFEYLVLVGLAECAGQYPSQLSGGMKQRVGIARALANKPRILLMDEPFGALDILTRETMRKELLSIWMQLQTTVLFVTHSISEAVHLADRILVMKDGEIKANIEVPLSRPRDEESTEFLRIAKDMQALLSADNQKLKALGG
ncbi:ABC transporter ATP-binding protein [Shouchella clausii]|uniref:ABC transporter n=2 Tax=Shouchella clausii TaxID=79880 RepID=A0A268S094_SHOCL|nr:ABC transporter ATP-binding protein [Shouchella clausii]PAD44107.1 ABC transporter [Bacillus sp. 7520-S]AST95986.1 ABC transporter [Shouchella clausii]MBU8595893.1 ABC transporter ATP-binding protein [Shouchella clausii]MCM3548391.1 ABC transporter ATP-binding protein [Shouchella clausii]MCR1288191.1 ABC transporter ATP-binding protein [Shouchella clausii]